MEPTTPSCSEVTRYDTEGPPLTQLLEFPCMSSRSSGDGNPKPTWSTSPCLLTFSIRTFGRRRRKRWCLRSASEGLADQPGLDGWSGA